MRLQQAVRSKRATQAIHRRRMKYGPWLKAARDFVLLLALLWFLIALTSWFMEG